MSWGMFVRKTVREGPMTPGEMGVASVFQSLMGWPAWIMHVEADPEQAVAYIYSERCDVYFVAGYTSQHVSRSQKREETYRA